MRLTLLLTAAVMALATPTFAENWQPVAGEPGTYIDTDFTRVDEKTGLVIIRTAMGTPGGARYDEWAEKEPIVMSAIDCKADTYKDLGLDFENAAALPDGWRGRGSQAGAKIGVGAASAVACKARETLQTVALP